MKSDSQDNLKPNAQGAERAASTNSPAPHVLLDLGSQAYLIDLLPMAAYAVRAPDGVITWFNSRAAQLWGRSPALGDTDERFCGAHTLYRSDGSYMAHGDTPVALALETGASVHEEEAIIERPDGSRVTVVVQIDPIRDQNGKIVGALNFFRDITARKRGERAAGLLAAIVNSSDDAIISKNLDGVITSWNHGAERIFGYTAEEALGRQVAMIIPPDHLDEEAEILAQLKRGERIDHFETVRVHKDGKKLDISLTISPVMDGAGRVVGASKVARDITERKYAERTLAERGLLLDLSNDAIVVRDEADRVTYWNKGASELYGYRREEAMGRVTHDLFQTEFSEPLDHITERLRRDKHWSGELRHRRKDGRQIIVFSRWALDLDERGNWKRVLETNNDVTRQTRIEKALRESEEGLVAIAEELESQVRARTDELEQRNEQLRELSNRLQRTQDEERRRIARDLHDSAGQVVAALGMQLASIAQRAVKPGVRKATEACHELVRELSKEIRTISYLLHPPLLDETGLPGAIGWYKQGLEERSGLKIDLELSEGFGRLPDDVEVAIFRIVQECLTNIHRHSGSKTATIRLSRDAGSIFLEVEDKGAGIPEEKLTAIRRQRAGVGFTGMRERVHHLKGALEIQSSPSGTRILATLPVATTAVSGPDATEQLASAAP